MEPAKRGILAQHVQLRRLMRGARDLVEQALDEQAPTPDAVASAIGEIRGAIEAHLIFEENVLVPLLDRDGRDGRKCAGYMLEEHRRQRALMSTLHQEAGAHPHLPILSAKLAFLASWLLADMADEEHRLACCQTW